MEKNLQISVLLDVYGGLLTEMQKNSLDLYYNEDLSLSEIAEHENISRQGVRDSIKRGEAELIRLEQALGLYETQNSCDKKLSAALSLLETAPEFDTKQEIADILSEIKNNL